MNSEIMANRRVLPMARFFGAELACASFHRLQGPLKENKSAFQPIPIRRGELMMAGLTLLDSFKFLGVHRPLGVEAVEASKSYAPRFLPAVTGSFLLLVSVPQELTESAPVERFGQG